MARRQPKGDVWGWDVEASDRENPWDRATLVIAKSRSGDREVYHARDGDPMERVASLMKRAGGTWFAHYGGGYDVPLLLNKYRPKRLVLSGSTILSATGAQVRPSLGKHAEALRARLAANAKLPKIPLKLRDSYPWWLSPLAKVGKAINLEKMDVDRALTERLTPEELELYCERDCDIVLGGHDACVAFLQEHGIPPEDEVRTAGSCAARLVEELEPGTWNALKRNRCHVDDIMSVLQSGAGRGGMVACNARGVVENVYVYDRKSAYPAAYAFTDIGIGLRPALDRELAKLETFEGVALARWRWTDRKRIPPALDQRTMCGVGECESWLTGPEIRRFLACGVRVTLREGWTSTEYLPVAQTFAEIMFRAKESGGSSSFFAKVFVNAWSGKTGMSPLQEQFTSWHPAEWWGEGLQPKLVPDGDGPAARAWWRYFTLAMDKDGMCEPFQQPLISIETFGRARAALWDIDDALWRAGWPVLYNDTDSVMTTCPPEKMPVPLGTGLGELAFEGGPYTGYFLGPKAYCLVDPTTGVVQKCALKGIPHRSYADGVIDDGLFREARGDERVKGKSFYARKGVGRDTRATLFKQALADEVKGARCMKDGLSTFLRGLQGVDDAGPGVWKRAPVERTVRPSGRGKVHFGGGEFSYLSTVEVACARMLPALPMRETRARVMFVDACVDFALERGLVEKQGEALCATYAARSWLAWLGPQWEAQEAPETSEDIGGDDD